MREGELVELEKKEMRERNGDLVKERKEKDKRER